MNKIFQIGFNKCATTAIHELFQNYTEPRLSSIHWDFGKLAYKMYNNYSYNLPLLSEYEKYDVFTDMECGYKESNRVGWLFGYKLFAELDNQYPNSKFIFNTRNYNQWIISRLNHKSGFMLIDNSVVKLNPKINYYESHMKFYKINSLNKLIDIWTKDWYDHYENVIKYFANKPNKLLIFNCETDSIDKIKKFIPELTITTDRFPVFNKTKV